MNVKRYTIAGTLSLAVHGAILLVAHEAKVFAMPAGTQSQSVSINFKAAAVPAPSVSPEADLPVKPETAPIEAAAIPEPIPTPMPTPDKPAVKTDTAIVKPDTAVVRPDKAAVRPEKTIVKKPVSKDPIKKVVAKQETTKPVVAKTPPKKAAPKPKKTAKVANTQAAPANAKPTEATPAEPTPTDTAKVPQKSNQGASAQPILVEKPSFLSRPTAPHYPRLARKRGLEGVALYEIWLDDEGNQVKQVLISSSGATLLDKSALDAIKQWQFSPHTVNGHSMAHRVHIPVRFKLDR